MLINFTSDQQINPEILIYNEHSSVLINGKINSFDNLRVGMEADVRGEYYSNLGVSAIAKLTLTENKDKIAKIESGRIDAIESDYVIIEGHKIKLSNKYQITGAKGSGYASKKFGNLKELKLGDLAEVTGPYDAGGFISATKIIVSPDVDRKSDVDAECLKNI